MASIWDILGLDGPTTERKDIKRAYARKLKATRPEDDPDGFMALRQAHDQALNYAKYQADYGEPIVMVPVQTDAIIPEASKNKAVDQSDVAPGIIAEPPVTTIDTETIAASRTIEPKEPSFAEVMTGRIVALLDNPWKRVQKSEWEALFNDEALVAIDAARDFEQILRNALLDYFGHRTGETDRHNSTGSERVLNSQIATYIFDEMGWHEIEDQPFYIREEIDILRHDLDVLNRNIYKPGDSFSDTGDDESNLDWSALEGFPVFLFVFVGYLVLKTISGMNGT